jgi:hypothetical protein
VVGLPGKEVVVYVGDLAPGAGGGRHHHPGEEIVYILEGTLVIKPDKKQLGLFTRASVCEERRRVRLESGDHPATPGR